MTTRHGALILAAMAAAVLTGCTSPDWAVREWDKRVHELKHGKTEEPQAQPEQPAQTPVSGSQAFLWKPISDGGGNAVVLTPASYRWHGSDTDKGKPGAIVMTRLYIRGGDRDGETASSYQPLKNGQPGVNGNRIHHRLKAKGEKYGDGFDVVADLAGGGEKVWRVKHGGKRQ